jgi:voltage-gated potassium channel Kch
VIADWHQLAANLGVATAMVAATVLISFWGFIGLTWLMRGSHGRLRPHAGRARAALLILMVVFGIFALHTIQIWMYAVLYIALGELRSFEEALYFSTVTFVSLGYGDVVLSTKWRVLSAIEAANGVVLIAWSTAFLLTVTARLKLLEHDWLESG